MMDLKSIIGMTAMGLMTSFIALCIYFDNKKRRDPCEKSKMEARMFLEQERIRKSFPNGGDGRGEETDEDENDNDGDNDDEEDNNDGHGSRKEARFLHQLQLGEAKIHCGDIDEGVRNLTSAVFLCDRPVPFLQKMQHVLSDVVFAKLMVMVEETRLKRHQLNSNEKPDLMNKQMQLVDVSSHELMDKFSYNRNGKNYNFLLEN